MQIVKFWEVSICFFGEYKLLALQESETLTAVVHKEEGLIKRMLQMLWQVRHIFLLDSRVTDWL